MFIHLSKHPSSRRSHFDRIYPLLDLLLLLPRNEEDFYRSSAADLGTFAITFGKIGRISSGLFFFEFERERDFIFDRVRWGTGAWERRAINFQTSNDEGGWGCKSIPREARRSIFRKIRDIRTALANSERDRARRDSLTTGSYTTVKANAETVFARRGRVS